jgi:hypothetical protein
MNQVSFNITADQVRAASRDYLSRGLLTAQKPDGRCVYQDGDFRCAVGAVFNREQLDVIYALEVNENADSSVLFERLKDRGYEVPDYQEQRDIEGLQGCHDEWLVFKTDYDYETAPETVIAEAEAENRFRDAING